jgi:RHS repeat-associated protein
MTSRTNGPAGSKLKLDFAYDYQSRRIQKIVSAWISSSNVPQSTNRFAYDGWNLRALLDSQSSIVSSFMWGLDLSGSMQGVGGVGGLLAISQYAPTNSQQFTCFDGNGNVTALVDMASSAITGQYEYGPFGELIRLTGATAAINPFRFSTKYQDEETGFLYYGFRYYNPSTGIWLSRDPIEEKGGNNLYGFVDNNAIRNVDHLGQWNSNVHYFWTFMWSVDAGITPGYAEMIGAADDATDSLWGGISWFPLWPIGQESRHMNYPLLHPPDSRDHWYNKEYAIAQKALKDADIKKKPSLCDKAARHFARGLHSRQDKSAHRDWPNRGNWEDWIAHPGWWDAYNDSELSDQRPSELFWSNWFHAHGDVTYDTWEGYTSQHGAMQYDRQLAMRREVKGASQGALGTFVAEIKKTCICRKLMLMNP